MNRTELEAELRQLYVAHQPSDHPMHTRSCEWCDKRIAQVMDKVDAYVAELTGTHRELITAEEVAKLYGYANAATARSILSRRMIPRQGSRPHPDTGRLQALYDAETVRSALR